MNSFKKLGLGLAATLAVTLTAVPAIADTPFGKSSRPATAKALSLPKIKAESPKALTMVPRLTPNSANKAQRPAVRPWSDKRASAPERVITSEQSGKIYGGTIYADNWSTSYQPVGIYAFEKGNGSTIEPVMVGDDYIVTGGGFFANGKYHFVSYMSFMGFVIADLYTVDFETWEIERDMPVDVGVVAQDMSYDPTTGNVYGCFMNDEGDDWIFGVLEPETGKRTKLSDLDQVVLTVAVNSKGEVYGIALDGNLYRFDKTTGAKTKIGSTGRKPMYSASGCFDLKDDTFYWECIEADAKANIYTVDVATGATTYVTTLANNMEMTGMFIPTADAEDDAPAAVKEITFDFEPGSKSGDILFTMPTTCFNSSNPLSGNLDWTLTVNEVESFTGTAEAGSDVKVSFTAPASGNYRIAVFTSNSAGRSPIVTTSVWIGNDAPAAVKNINIGRTENPGEVVLSWDAPAASLHGGYMNPEEIRYDIVRMPEGDKVGNAVKGTTFTETFDVNSPLTLHSYLITPMFEGEEGETASSPEFAAGSASLPYYNMFNDQSDFSQFTVEDTNGDGVTWEHDAITETARIKYSFYVDDEGYHTPAMDDWFFTAPVKLQSGRMIKVSVDANTYSGAYGSSYTERFEIKLGSRPASTDMDRQVIDVTNVTNTTPKTFTGYTSVEEDGLYYIGIHGCSPADQFYLYIDNLLIDNGPLLGTPAAVGNLKATAGANGALQATISFVAPNKTVDGADLTSIDRIELRRGNKLIHTFTNPAPGESLSFTDQEAAQGDNTYSVVAINEKGEGYTSQTTVFVGHDRPGLPVNVQAKEVDGKVVITWQAPLSGETGGYYNPADVTYTIVRANDEAELAVGLKALTFTDANPPLNGQHHEFFTYYVYAQSPGGYGYGLASNSVCTGQAFDVPFRESFSNGKLAAGPWDVMIPEESYGWWQIVSEGSYPTASPQDRDSGMVTFIPEEEGDSGRLISGKISMKNVTAPTLDFWYYASQGVTDRIYVYVNADDKGEKLVDVVNVGSGRNEGWTKASFDLSAYASADKIQIVFNAVSSDAYSNIHIDNISVRETYDNNLAVTGLSAPSRMMATEPSKVTVEISNLGLNSISAYSVELYRDGKLEATAEPGRLTSGDVREVEFDVTPVAVWGSEANFQARIVCALDENEADDESDVVTVEITDLNFPAVTDLTATRSDSDSSVLLEWNEPNFVAGQAQEIVEDVEDIKAFSIDNLGDWTVIDGDMKPTYGINNGGSGELLSYENAGKPMAFMAFNPKKAGVPVEYSDGTPTDWAPHSGDQYFAAFAVDGQNDDWLISPLLPGIQQEISFWVRSVTADYGYEKYEVYYSTTGVDKSDFKLIGDQRSAPIIWVEDKAVLPEGTRYFAIRCVSEDAFVFMLDDIKFKTADSYMGELSMMGYNVYRDREPLTEKPIMEQTFIDTTVDNGKHIYNVTAVYDLGESRLSNDATVDSSGVGRVENLSLRVEAGKGELTVIAEEGMEVDIFDASGLRIASFVSTGRDSFILHPGIYLVSASRGSVKAIVR